jgi:hypothetical protein
MPRPGEDHVIDVIASIESQRHRSEQDFGLAASCNQALRKLRELLDRECEALPARGSGTRYPLKIKTVAVEIARVKKLLGNTRRDGFRSGREITGL